MGQAEWASALAQRLLEESLPRRWAHTRGVAAQAVRLAPILGDDADLLAAATWLHDIGYAADLAATGFHPLDGARYLRDAKHADDRICRLVAHHSCASVEAEERGLASALAAEFPPEREDLTQALIYCDMTTGPDGECISLNHRLSDIMHRYGRPHPVSRSMLRAVPTLTEAVEATRVRIRQQTCPH